SLTSPPAQASSRWSAASIQDEPPRRGFGPPPGLEAPPPLDPPPRPGRQSAPPPRGETVPPEDVLAVGDRSGTIEIDPEIEGVEVEESRPSPGTATIDAPTEVSDPSIELSTQDLLPGSVADESIDQPFEPRSTAAQRAIPPVDAAVDAPAPRSSGEWSARAAPRPVARPPSSGAPRMDELFPEDEEGVSSLELIDPRTGDVRRGGARGLPGALAQGGGPGSPGAPDAMRYGRSRSEDMRMIRQGLGLPPESSPGRPAPAAPVGPTYPTVRRPAEPSAGWDARRTGGPSRAPAPAPRRGIPLIVYALLALLVVGGAVLAGFKVRSMRL